MSKLNKKQVSIYEAKTQLSKLIKEAVSGVEIIIAKGKKPIVKLVVIEDEHKENAARMLGKYDGKVEIPSDFDEPLKDLEDYT